MPQSADIICYLRFGQREAEYRSSEERTRLDMGAVIGEEQNGET